MVAMVIGKTVRSKVPTLPVDAGLAVGRYRFRLVVVDDEANESAPSELIIQVLDPPATTTTTTTATRTTTTTVTRTATVSIPTEILIRRPLGGTR